MIKLGDCITVKPATFDVPGKDGKPKAIPGTVVYIHPAGRCSTRRSPCVGRSVDGNRPGVRVYRTRRGYAGGR